LEILCYQFGNIEQDKQKISLIKARETYKREVVNKLKELVSLGENVEYQKQHIENIKDMVGKDRIFK
ncbi:hypothetical protein N9V34_04700, partial [Flavobacteriaceae bacterium]|nr:hypothetical protein [Flavobacteriaceae bacterium]